MARKKTTKTRINVKTLISSRLREVRQELFGDHGGPELARRLGLPARTWYNYETGVTVPAEVLLSFIDQTGTNPVWLLSGDGPRYRRELEDIILAEMTPEQLIRRGLEKLEQEPQEVVIVAPENLPTASMSDFIAVGLVPITQLDQMNSSVDSVEGYVMAYRHWLPHPSETVSVRLDDDAMFPILPEGSIVAVDRAMRDPHRLQGRIVAANPGGRPMIRWLDVSARHMILRPNQPGRDHPMVPIEIDAEPSPIIGQVVWSWSRFHERNGL